MAGIKHLDLRRLDNCNCNITSDLVNSEDQDVLKSDSIAVFSLKILAGQAVCWDTTINGGATSLFAVPGSTFQVVII